MYTMQYERSLRLSLDEYGNDVPEKKLTSNDEEPKMIMEDMNTETSTALVQNDDPDSIAHAGRKFACSAFL